MSSELGSVTQWGRYFYPWRVREGRRAVPESLGLGPDRVVGLASFLNQERRMQHDEIHRGDRLPAALTGGVMCMKLGTRAMHTYALAKQERASEQSFF